jgi:hypothetical protein
MEDEKEQPETVKLSGGSFKAHADARALATLYADVPEGETITYGTVEDFIGFSVQEQPGYNRSYRAREIVRREHGKVFECDMKIGLRCLTDSDKATLPTRAARKIYRHVKRVKKKVQTIKDIGSLSDREKLMLNVGMAQMSLIESASSDKGRKAIESKADEVTRSIPSLGALEALRHIDLSR